jgi:hypothetical protein
MWQVYAMLAHDLIRDRQREAAIDALNRAFQEQDANEAPAPFLARPGLVRRASAGALRRVGNAAIAVADRACSAASRLEGRIA